MRDERAVSLIYDKMSAPAQYNFGVPRDSITSVLQYLTVELMWPPGQLILHLVIYQLVLLKETSTTIDDLRIVRQASDQPLVLKREL